MSDPVLFGGVKLVNHPDLENIRLMDANIIRPIAEMQRFGIGIDIDYIQELGLELASNMQSLESDIKEFIPIQELAESLDDEALDFNPNSPLQLSTLLFSTLGVGSDRQLKRSKSGAHSTGKKELEKLKQDHPIISKILEYREVSKLKNTYCDALPRLAKFHNRGECKVCGAVHLEPHYRIHTTIVSTRTATGRLSSRKPNLNQVPARTEWGRKVRKSFIATKGKSLIAADYSQIELRWMADRSHAVSMIEVFKKCLDIHTDTACRAFKKTILEVESSTGKLIYRAPCKNVNFGVCYGLQAPGLYDLMAITYAVSGLPLPAWLDIAWCEVFINQWLNELYPEVKDYLNDQSYRARRYGITWCAFGGVRRIPEIHSAHERIRAAGLRQAGNNPIQRGAAGIFKIGLARVARMLANIRESGAGARLLLPIHDELVVESDSEHAEAIAGLMKWEMSNALLGDDGHVHSRVPIKTEASIMREWTK